MNGFDKAGVISDENSFSSEPLSSYQCSRLLDALSSLASLFPAFAADGDNGSILDPDG
jgi:hypothetical protein